MSAIQKFTVKIVTSSHPDAGTDGDVYIGMCGREFYIDSQGEDFERNSTRTYRFGAGSNVLYEQANDPRGDYPIYTEDIDLTPSYIRFAPKGRKDHWDLESVKVVVNPNPPPDQETGEVVLEALLTPPEDHLWLGVHSGMYCYLWTTTSGPFLLRQKRTRKQTKSK
jgi:PLAT/LH2 domain